MTIESEGSGQLDSVLAQYLRDRDASCPRCGYNLRDIERSSCPECSCPLDFHVVDRINPESQHRTLHLAILFLVLYCAIYVIVNTASLITVLVDGTIPATLFSGFMFFGGQLFWMFVTVWTVRLWSRSRKGTRLRTKHFLRPAIAILIMHLLGMGFHIYAAVLSLSSII